jgi:hypothetical protein
MLAVESYVLCKIKQPNFKARKIRGEKVASRDHRNVAAPFSAE